jgi:hypothetical protein
MDIPHNSYNPFSPARLWYVKEIRVDTDGPKPTLVSTAAKVGCDEGFSMRATARIFGARLTLARVDKPLKEEAVGC